MPLRCAPFWGTFLLKRDSLKLGSYIHPIHVLLFVLFKGKFLVAFSLPAINPRKGIFCYRGDFKHTQYLSIWKYN